MLKKLLRAIHPETTPDSEPPIELPPFTELFIWEGFWVRYQNLQNFEDMTIGKNPEQTGRLEDDEVVRQYNDLPYSYSYLMQSGEGVFNPYPILHELAARHALRGSDVLPPDFAPADYL